MASGSEDSNWANLPSLPLDMVLKKVIPLQDFFCFGAVCRSWRNAAMSDPKHTQYRFESCTKQVPFLMMPPEENEKKWWSVFKKRQWKSSLCTLSTRKLPTFKLSIPYKYTLLKCCGSSHGWLAFCKGSDKEQHVSLFNPFSHKKINKVPMINHPWHSPRDYFVRKVILSTNPSASPNDFYIIAICGGMSELHVLKYNQKIWTRVKYPRDHYGMYECFSDLIFHQGQLYSVYWFGNLHSIDLVGVLNKKRYPVYEIKLSPRLPDYCNFIIEHYLVESSFGDLLMVRRLFAYDDLPELSRKRTVGFQVFEVILGSNNSYTSETAELVEIEGLGGDALFVGDNISFSISSSKFPECQPDSIYFTNHLTNYIVIEEQQIPYDVGVYDMKSGSIERHYQSCYTSLHIPPPIWVTPTPLFQLYLELK